MQHWFDLNRDYMRELGREYTKAGNWTESKYKFTFKVGAEQTRDAMLALLREFVPAGSLKVETKQPWHIITVTV